MAEPLRIKLPWGMTVWLHLDDGQLWIGIRDEDAAVEVSTRLEPEATALIAGFLTGSLANRPGWEDR